TCWMGDSLPAEFLTRQIRAEPSKQFPTRQIQSCDLAQDRRQDSIELRPCKCRDAADLPYTRQLRDRAPALRRPAITGTARRDGIEPPPRRARTSVALDRAATDWRHPLSG